MIRKTLLQDGMAERSLKQPNMMYIRWLCCTWMLSRRQLREDDDSNSNSSNDNSNSSPASDLIYIPFRGSLKRSRCIEVQLGELLAGLKTWSLAKLAREKRLTAE